MRSTHLLLLVAAASASCGGAAPPSVGVPSSDPPATSPGDAFTPRWERPAPTMRDYGPFQVQLGNGTFAYLEQQAPLAETSSMLLPGIGGRVYNYSLFVDETQAVELFGVLIPDAPPGVERPLLTAFHGFGTSHRDIDARTTLYEEADERGWFLVAPLQRSLADPTGDNFDIHFSSVESQLHVEAVLQFVMDNYAVDRERLYGVGFSMGGGAALNFAARHRDPARFAFAAAVNHTGSVAVGDVYRTSRAGGVVRDILELIFGGSPADAPFGYRRSSVIELDDQGVLVPDGAHMAVNLGHVPTQTWINTSDPLTELLDQSYQLDAYFQPVLGAPHEFIVVPSTSDPICNGSQHCWATMNQKAACDWLALHALNAFPLSGSILADRAGRWEYFELTQEVSGKFSRLGYGVDPQGNFLEVTEPENLVSIATSFEDLGLDSSAPFKLTMTGFDAAAVPLVFQDVVAPPLDVLREGLVVTEDCSGQPAVVPTWCYDPAALTLTIIEVEPNIVRWQIRF